MKQIIVIAGISLMAASCGTTVTKEKDAVVAAQQRTIDSMKIEMVKQQVIDSMTEAAALAAVPQEAPVVKTVVVKPKKQRTVHYANYQQPVAENTTGSYTGYSNTASEPSVATPPIVYQEPQAPATPEKKGWSAKAKGAVIGAAAGAIGGAVINKKQRAIGAVVGGILGAGAGTGIGAVIDKKKGR